MIQESQLETIIGKYNTLDRLLSRIAAFNAYNNTFRIIDLVTRSPLVSVDLRQEVDNIHICLINFFLSGYFIVVQVF